MTAMLMTLAPVAVDLGVPDAALDDPALYVAAHLLDGRPLFDVLADPAVAVRLDDEPFLLEDPTLRLVCAQLARSTG